MCGRFSLTAAPADVQAVFALATPPALPPRYNIAPTQQVPIVRVGASGARELVLVRWGLIPYFAKDASVGNRMINARAESVTVKPSFRDAFRRRRCLVVADGFYEWQAGPFGKTPHYIRSADGRPFAFAGLWDRWRAPDGQVVESCTIITTDANATVRPLHDRMPVILEGARLDEWLDPATPPERLRALLAPPAEGALRAHPVSTLVNRPENDLPECVMPVTAESA